MDAKTYEAVTGYLQGGYGPSLARGLYEVVTRFLPLLIDSGEVPGDEALDDYWSVCDLLRALLKDEWGVEL